MADKKEDAKAAEKGKEAKPKKRGKLGFYMTMVVLVFAAPFMFPTVVLLMVGMIPTLIVLFTDNDVEKSSTAAVAAMNCAGVAPFIIDLWVKGQTMANVFHILREPSNWLIMLGAAGIGQLIVFTIPQAMASLTLARMEMRHKVLKHNLEQLKTTWGPDVATVKPMDKIVRTD